MLPSHSSVSLCVSLHNCSRYIDISIRSTYLCRTVHTDCTNSTVDTLKLKRYSHFSLLNGCDILPINYFLLLKKKQAKKPESHSVVIAAHRLGTQIQVHFGRLSFSCLVAPGESDCFAGKEVRPAVLKTQLHIRACDSV